MSISTHRFSLGSIVPQQASQEGARADATVHNFPVLSGMSLSLLNLGSGGVREPHWHPNANELGYCLEGRALYTIFAPGFQHETFTIEPGCLSFIPMGYAHYIENIGEGPLRIMICFDHESPQDINLSSAVQSMSAPVLAKTFKLEPSFFEGLTERSNPVFIYKKQQSAKPELSWTTNRFKFDLESLYPQIQTKGGWVKMSDGALFPALERLAAFSLLLEKNGVREPHWHPNAHELNYLMSGTAKITLLSPDGTIDTFDMKAGDISFLPKGYFHHIENTGEEAARFIVFFNHENPTDIGLTGFLGAYSNQTLAPLFNVSDSYLDQLPHYQKDLFVVGGGG